MRYVYLDNYRGFSNSLIPIKDVNFLVGENSTGKTSILGLLRVLSAEDLLMKRDFGFRELGFTSYKDAVSIESNDKSYFSIGAISCSEEGVTGKEDDHISHGEFLLVLTFKEKDGLPALSSVVSIRNGLQINIKYNNKNIFYKIQNSDNSEDLIRPSIKRITGFVNLAQSDKTGYRKLENENAVFYLQAPPMFLISHLEHEYQLRTEPKKRFTGFEIRSLIGNTAWIAPIRSKPRKTYDEYSLEFSPEGDHTPYLIKKQLDNKSGSEEFRKAMEDFGRVSGLFRSVEIKKYGKGASAPFELDVVLAKSPLSVNSVGYGVSQALPVAVEIFARQKHTWFAIQQPEVHLHPRAQAAFGKVVFDLAILEKKKFIIETHSDYMIDRYRIMCKQSKKHVDSQVLYFERTKGGNAFCSIPIDVNGNLSPDQPKGYREFFIKEEMDILGL